MSEPASINGLQTEQRNPRSTHIDTVSTLELCEIANTEDASIAAAVRDCLPSIANAIDAISERVRRGGRVIYVGAGTSGRLGVLDASEIPPTYSAPAGQFVGIIAGGDNALRFAIEGAEDSRQEAIQDLEAQNLDGAMDSLIGIASSGRTPYVLSGLEFAKSRGCITVGIACVSPSELRQRNHVDFAIEAVTGPEIVTGSTRMKAGTATKLILNMISSGIMIRVGKTFGNIMVDVKPTNLKLKQRARRIIHDIVGPSCSSTDAELDDLLLTCDGSVKLASAVLCLGIPVREARLRLDAANGVLAAALHPMPPSSVFTKRAEPTQVTLCVDAGGSQCRATVMLPNGDHATGLAGPCNVAEIGVDAAVVEIRLAIERALKDCSATRSESLESLRILAAWIAIAGADRRGCATELRGALRKLLCSNTHLHVTNDLALLATLAGQATTADNVVVLVSGTGSIAISYNRTGASFVQRARAGGWGPLLGDGGSGFDIGRRAICSMLKQIESEGTSIAKSSTQSADALRDAVIAHYRPSGEHRDNYDLLSTILLGETGRPQTPGSAKRRIADCAPLVIGTSKTSAQSAEIIKAAQHDLVELLNSVVDSKSLETSPTVLVLAGGVFSSSAFRFGFLDLLKLTSLKFLEARQIAQPTLEGARYLMSNEV